MKKKITCLFLILVMTLTPVFTIIAGAEVTTPATITAKAVLSGDDKTLTVTLMLESSVEVFATEIQIKYDTSLLTLQSTEDEIMDSSEFPDSSMIAITVCYNNQPDTVKFTELNVNKGVNSCLICTLKFSVKGTLTEQSPGFSIQQTKLLDETIKEIIVSEFVQFSTESPVSETVTAKTNLASVGNYMTVDVMLNSSFPAYGVTINVVYDTSKLVLYSSEEDIVNSSLFPHSSAIDVYSGYMNSSGVRFNALDINKGTTSCRILEIVFKVKDTVTKDAPGFHVGVEAVLNENANNMETGTCAKIEFVNPGDVNNDNYVHLDDAMLTFQHVAGKITLEGTEFVSADVTSDGVIKLDDAMKIFQFVSGKLTTF